MDALDLVRDSSIGNAHRAKIAGALSRQVEAIFQSGALSRQDKLLILAATCFSRRHAEPGRRAAEMALQAGASEDQLEEMLLVLYVSRGALAYLEARAALGGIVGKAEPPPEEVAPAPTDLAEIYGIFRGYYGGELPAWVSRMAELDADLLRSVQTVRDIVFRDGHASLKLKELAFVSINAADRYDYGTKRHVKTAADAGASTAEIVEAIAVAMLEGGNVAWIEGINSLADG